MSQTVTLQLRMGELDLLEGERERERDRPLDRDRGLESERDSDRLGERDGLQLSGGGSSLTIFHLVAIGLSVLIPSVTYATFFF